LKLPPALGTPVNIKLSNPPPGFKQILKKHPPTGFKSPNLFSEILPKSNQDLPVLGSLPAMHDILCDKENQVAVSVPTVAQSSLVDLTSESKISSMADLVIKHDNQMDCLDLNQNKESNENYFEHIWAGFDGNS
jgi:hypothetical protein